MALSREPKQEETIRMDLTSLDSSARGFLHVYTAPVESTSGRRR